MCIIPPNLPCIRGGNRSIIPTVEQKIERALIEIRPFIAQHLGDVEFVKFENNICYVRMLGTCHGCPLSEITLKGGIEEIIKASVPEVIRVEAVL